MQYCYSLYKNFNCSSLQLKLLIVINRIIFWNALDLQRARGLNREDAMDRSKLRCIKQIRINDHDRCELVNVSSGTGSPELSQTKSIEP